MHCGRRGETEGLGEIRGKSRKIPLRNRRLGYESATFLKGSYNCTVGVIEYDIWLSIRVLDHPNAREVILRMLGGELRDIFAEEVESPF